MNKLNYIVLILGFTVLFTACEPEKKLKKDTEIADNNSLLENRYQKLLAYKVDSLSFPRSMSLNPEEIHKVPSKDWTSGFFPGSLWQIFKLTGNEKFKEKAVEWTALMENQKYNDKTHDMGFKIYCSFGEGLKVEDNQFYKDVIVESAKTLSTRFNEKVGSLRSWDFNSDIWEFPVIVDNMLNLELLFEATKISGDSTFHKIAETHAETTLKNHFRPDNSIYHVVVYDTITGVAKMKVTHQGFNDESTWARGQGWGIYGYTMAYRYTKNPAFLKQAEATAKFYMEHKNLPEDGIPYWDFNDPAIPKAPRDASAAAVVTSALYELYGFTKNKVYLDFANKVLDNLNSTKYLLDATVNGPFILNHSTGNWPKNDEIDEPISYADYYFLEALLRKKAL
ncbi:Glycosyl Hydrolase Family 88 [Lutibacter agarilyticus]|uniref:Glycosyl Hydrolase Family 88 n=1 Tax=Lutibacter agarilyticus TaxID=1109740 RepID=A0A238Z7E6_9FLAO|nr:glycoside hydrolase family 88 protein [Lutibacter agarilyticus]SNR78949.1 Glycosyl Hydrolase Family 88 [Lutibacter agarilyticus]